MNLVFEIRWKPTQRSCGSCGCEFSFASTHNGPPRYVGAHEKRGQDKVFQVAKTRNFRSWLRQTLVRSFVGRVSTPRSLGFKLPAALSADPRDHALRCAPRHTWGTRVPHPHSPTDLAQGHRGVVGPEEPASYGEGHCCASTPKVWVSPGLLDTLPLRALLTQRRTEPR